MALNLKRKRTADSGPRKARKVSEDPEGTNILSADEDDDNISEGDRGDEDGEWPGIGDDEGAVEREKPQLETTGQPKKPPMAEEMRVIHEATDLYRSSSFKLQIDALIPNVRPKVSRTAPLDRFLLNLHTFLVKLSSISPQHPLTAARDLLKKGIAVPYCLPLPTEDTNWKVAFEKPSDITLVGSWPNKISIKPKDDLYYGVDIAVQMPESLFQEKDYLNARFFQKKAFYLASIAAAIQKPKSGFNVDVFYESSSGDPRLTKLVLIPKSDGTQSDFTKLKARVGIIPTMSTQSPIPLHRLSPSHSNLKISTSDDASTAQPLPTPIYNNALLCSFTPKVHLLATYNLIQSTPAFSDALTLLKVWANQRGFGKGSRMCVKGFEDAGPFWTGLLEVLINGEDGNGAKQHRPIGKGLSSYQLFKSALHRLVKVDITKTPAFVKSQDGQRYEAEEYKENWPATMLDSSSFTNLVASMPVGCLEMLRYEASKTLETLSATSLAVDPFTQVFLQDHRDILFRFDVVLRIDVSDAKPRKSSIHASLDRGSPFLHFLFSLDSFLRKSLGGRVKAVSLLYPTSTKSAPSTRPLSQAHPPTPSVVFVGLILDPEHAFQLVLHGPAAGEQVSPELAAFRELWGPKSELRRFKDGRITESVVWDVKTADEKSHIPAMIVRHILDWHFGIKEDKVISWQTSYDDLIRLPRSVSTRIVESTAGGGIGFKGAIQAFDALVKAIKAQDDELPLSLVNASPISDSLRYTSVFGPVPLTPSLAASLPPTARYLQPIEIVFEFEKSGKWPDELRAIQKIKLAFFERVGACLMSGVPGLKASVVIGNGDTTDSNELMDKSCLEIVTVEGWAFRARIWHDREATLLDRILDDKGPLAHIAVSKQKRQEERKGQEYLDAVVAKDVYLRRFIHAPRHHRAIAALCHQHVAFPGTCRLVKRWFASHWFLGGHVTEEAVELLCAQFFVWDGKLVDAEMEAKLIPSSVPSTKERGFATVLAFLSQWKWEEGPIWVCLYGPNSNEGEELAKAAAPYGSGGVWALQTDMDKEGKMWTKSGPDAIVAKRIRALAGATCKYMQGVETDSFDVQAMFTHPTDDYDFLVHLDPTALPRYAHNINPEPALLSRQKKYANPVEHPSDVMPGFDPARSFFEDLQRMYSDTFRLFFDPYGGTQFGGVWDPTLKTARPFRVLGGFSSKPVLKEKQKEKDKGLVILNEDSILAEVERMGTGLVQRVVVRSRA